MIRLLFQFPHCTTQFAPRAKSKSSSPQSFANILMLLWHNVRTCLIVCPLLSQPGNLWILGLIHCNARKPHSQGYRRITVSAEHTPPPPKISSRTKPHLCRGGLDRRLALADSSWPRTPLQEFPISHPAITDTTAPRPLEVQHPHRFEVCGIIPYLYQNHASQC